MGLSRRSFLIGTAAVIAVPPPFAIPVALPTAAPSIFAGEMCIYYGVIIREMSSAQATNLSVIARSSFPSLFYDLMNVPEDEDGYLPPGDEEEEALDDPDEWRDYSDE